MAGAHKKRAAAIAAARKTKAGGRKKTVPGSGRSVAGGGCDGDGRRLLVLALGFAAVGGRGGLDQREEERTSVVEGQMVYVRLDIRGRGVITRIVIERHSTDSERHRTQECRKYIVVRG